MAVLSGTGCLPSVFDRNEVLRHLSMKYHMPACDKAGIWADYQFPVFCMEIQGSLTSSLSPFCKSSIEIPSGDLMNAM